MFEQKLLKNLKEEENVIEIVRKYPLVFAAPTIVSILFIIIPFFLMYPLFRWSNWGVVVFFVLVGIGILLALRVFVIYSYNVFMITNERIIDIDQRGLFDRTVSEITYDKIQDVSFRRKGVLQTVLHYGNVIVQTASSQVNIELNGVKNPEYVQQVIVETQKEVASRHPSNDSITKLVEKLDAIREEGDTPSDSKHN